MTDFVKLILNENFGSSSFFKGGPVGICFASWKKSGWFLPPQHIKKWEKVWFFFQTWRKCSARSFWQRGQTRHEKIEISKKNSMNLNLYDFIMIWTYVHFLLNLDLYEFIMIWTCVHFLLNLNLYAFLLIGLVCSF